MTDVVSVFPVGEERSDDEAALLAMCDAEFGWEIDEFVAVTRRVVPSLLARVEAAEAENERLNRRLFPGQGENYANEVERQRAVIETFQAAVKQLRADLAAAVAKLRAVEAALGRDRFGHIAKSRIRAALADPVGPPTEPQEG